MTTLHATITPLVYLLAAVAMILGIKMLPRVRTARRGWSLAAVGVLAALAVTVADAGASVQRLTWVGLGALAGGLGGAVMAMRRARSAQTEGASWSGLAAGAAALLALAAFLPGHSDVASGISPAVVPGTGRAVVAGLAILVAGMGVGVAVMTLLRAARGRARVVAPAAVALRLSALGLTVLLGVAFTGALALCSRELATAPVVWLLLAFGVGAGALTAAPLAVTQAPVLAALAASGAGAGQVLLGFLAENAMLIIVGGMLTTAGISLARLFAAGLGQSLPSMLAARGNADQDAAAASVRTCDAEEAAMSLEGARRVVIVPGYGMAVAQAQHAVHELAELLAKRGAEVLFAIHPYAGRIPGHMNYLLDEVSVPHENLREPAEIAEFLTTADAVIAVGANDVVNPAAADARGPLGGMPLLDLSRAGAVFVIMRGLAPGFTGVPNRLFQQPNATLVLGDAKRVVQSLISELKAAA